MVFAGKYLAIFGTLASLVRSSDAQITCADASCEPDTDLPETCDGLETEFNRTLRCAIDSGCPEQFGFLVGECILRSIGPCFLELFRIEKICFNSDILNATEQLEGFGLGECGPEDSARCDSKLPSEANQSKDCEELHYKYQDYRHCFSECAGDEAGPNIYEGICQTSFEIANLFYANTCNLQTACFSNLDNFVEKIDNSSPQMSAGGSLALVLGAFMLLFR